MKFPRHLSRLALVAACGAALPVLAESPDPSFAFKIHSGVTAGQLRTDHVSNQALGFDLAGRFPLGATSAFTVELGFDYIPGRDHDAMPTSGPIYYNYQTPVTSYNEQPLYLSQTNSIDLRKESLQGFSLRGGYTDSLPGMGAWYWFAGASLDLQKSRAQFSGTLIPSYGSPATTVPNYEPVDPANPDGPLKDYYEGWAFVTEKAKLSVGLLAGVGVPLGENFKFEFRVRNLGFTHFDYRPFTYTGTTPVLNESTHRGFVFELSLSLAL